MGVRLESLTYGPGWQPNLLSNHDLENQMGRTQRIELLRPRHAQYLSIVDLIVFVTAFAIWFGGMRIAGLYGFALGCFALHAASGRLLKRNDWQLGALCGALTLVGALSLAWLTLGTFGKAYPDYAEMSRDKLQTVARWIDDYHNVHRKWPNKLSDLPAASQSRNYRFGYNFNAQRSFDYERTEAGFDLTFLGANDRQGGIGIDADISLADADEFANRRIPIVDFFTHSPGVGCLTLTLMFCFAVGLIASILFHRDSGQLRHDLIAVAVLATGASVAGCLLVGVSLVFLPYR